ncbi:MAG: serpin family protein [Bacteroidales bacterium]|nr:serpin family protein [Bacteroidales bacterium]
MNTKFSFLAGVLLIHLAVTGQIHPEQMDALKVAQGSNRFAFDLVRHLPVESNMVFSPFSISTALAMVQAGASGQTEEEIQKTMHFPDQQELLSGYMEITALLQDKNSESLKLFIANALWAQQGYAFSEDYFSLMQKYFSVEPGYADFKTEQGRSEAVQKINTWISEHTENLIRNMVSPGVLNPLTRLVLANAVYFNGLWKKEFNPEKTGEDVFYLNDGQVTQVKYMSNKSRYRYFRNEEYSCIDIPYSEGNLSMLALLPEKNDIENFTADFGYDNFAELQASLMYEEVEIFLPGFKFEFFSSLAEILSEMGMEQAFSDQADFSRITGIADLKIDKVLHKAMIEVNEQGTEAAAATVVTMMEKSAGPGSSIYLFKADHPFVFIIYDNETSAILFMGRIMDPALN